MKRGTRYFLITTGEYKMVREEAILNKSLLAEDAVAWVTAKDYDALEEENKAIIEATNQFCKSCGHLLAYCNKLCPLFQFLTAPPKLGRYTAPDKDPT